MRTKEGFAVFLIIGGLFALWLYNTGRVSAFKQFVLNAPGQSTLPTPGKKVAAAGGGGSSVDANKVAQCGAAASEGVITADCLSAFSSAISRPGDLVASAVKGLTFGIVHL